MSLSNSLGSDPVTLEEMLSAREHRAKKQRDLLARYPGLLISFSLNIAGSHKVFPLAKAAFAEGCSLIRAQLRRNCVPVAASQTERFKTGETAYYAVSGDAVEVKRILCIIETHNPLGRLFDIDLLRSDKSKVSRIELGLPERSCLICGGSAGACARSRAHALEEVQQCTVKRMRNYFYEQYADKLSSMAVRALLYEVSVTPKPGLVDRAGNGAHSDMNFYTFLDSASALAPQFRAFCLLGCQNCGLPKEELFHKARYQGQLAEEAMFGATGGVNTHKGLIFSLGLLCAAAGCLYAKCLETGEEIGGGADLSALLGCCAELAKTSLPDLDQVADGCSKTNGKQVFRQYGIQGVRGQAARGFPDALCQALPVLDEKNPDYTGCLALLHLFAVVQDTNLLHRGGSGGLDTVRESAQKMLERISIQNYKQELEQMDRRLVELWISPGGCADLLAIAFFLQFYQGGLPQQKK